MKESILAQSITQEFVDRFPTMAEKFVPELFAFAVLDFLQKGKDDPDRADAVRLALAKSNRRSTIESILENAQAILVWPPKPKPIVLRPALVKTKRRRK